MAEIFQTAEIKVQLFVISLFFKFFLLQPEHYCSCLNNCCGIHFFHIMRLIKSLNIIKVSILCLEIVVITLKLLSINKINIIICVYRYVFMLTSIKQLSYNQIKFIPKFNKLILHTVHYSTVRI